jgi:Protein of unknown function (DUF2971)
VSNLEDLKTQLQQQEEKWLEAWMGSQGEPPDGSLYHYTDSKGLIGILENRVFWATNIQHLNDRSEITHGADLVRRRLDAALKGQSGPLATLLVQAKDKFNPFDILTVYVACFSELKDDLSQWRAYGQSGGGYAIGISPRFGHRPEKVPLISLRRVIYEEAKQIGLIDDAISTLMRFAAPIYKSGYPSGHEQMADQLLRFFKRRIGDYLWCFKNPAFRDEREWRFTYIGGPFGMGDRPLKFRPSPGGVVPFVELNLLDLMRGEKERLVVSEIVCGPTLHPDEAMRTAHTLAHMTKHVGVTISSSVVPLRR